MEQPTARRRRHAGSAESVTVADLLAKSTPDERANVSRIQERAAAEASAPSGPATPDDTYWETMPPPEPPREQTAPSTELVRYEDAVEEQDSTGRLAKTIAGTLLAMVLCGAVTAATVVNGPPAQRRNPSMPALRPALTAGPAVVRPLTVIDQLVNGALDDIPAGGDASGGDPARTAGLGPVVDRGTAEDVVRRFYGALPLHPKDAFPLLGPALQDDNFESFDRSWIGSRAVDAHVLRPRPEDGDLLRVEVSTEQLDGSVLEVVELVEVRTVPGPGKAAEPRITDVWLLAAYQG